MKHKDKVKLARKMLTKDEIKYGISFFDSKNWVNRKKAKAKKQQIQGKAQKTKLTTSCPEIFAKLKWYQLIWRIIKRIFKK